MITDIEDYFARGCGRCPRFATSDCSTRVWSAGIARLRRICRDAGLEETVKWGHPCYTHAGRNIALIGALRDTFRISFFNAALMRDPEGVLERSGPNTQHADVIRFADLARLEALAPVVTAYLKEAMGYAEAGARPERSPVEIELPEELVIALDADPELAEAFHGLTPGRQRSYVIHLGSTGNPETRRARIVRLRPKILAGKGAMER